MAFPEPFSSARAVAVERSIEAFWSRNSATRRGRRCSALIFIASCKDVLRSTVMKAPDRVAERSLEVHLVDYEPRDGFDPGFEPVTFPVLYPDQHVLSDNLSDLVALWVNHKFGRCALIHNCDFVNYPAV